MAGVHGTPRTGGGRLPWSRITRVGADGSGAARPSSARAAGSPSTRTSAGRRRWPRAPPALRVGERRRPGHRGAGPLPTCGGQRCDVLHEGHGGGLVRRGDGDRLPVDVPEPDAGRAPEQARGEHAARLHARQRVALGEHPLRDRERRGVRDLADLDAGRVGPGPRCREAHHQRRVPDQCEPVPGEVRREPRRRSRKYGAVGRDQLLDLRDHLGGLGLAHGRGEDHRVRQLAGGRRPGRPPSRSVRRHGRPSDRATSTGHDACTSTACRISVSSSGASGSHPLVRCSPGSGTTELVSVTRPPWPAPRRPRQTLRD